MSEIQLKSGFQAKDFSSQKELWLSKGDVFLYEGDIGKNNCYLILQGRLDVRLISGSGHETLLYQLEENDLVGELAMFGKNVRTATIVATSRVCLLEISYAEFKGNLSKALFLEKLASHFLQRYLKTHEVVCRLGQPNIGMKLCRYFKTLAEQTGGYEEKVSIRLPSHSVLGKLLSCQRESVTRELKKLVQAEILEQKEGSAYLLNIVKVDLYLGDMMG